ncbi:hypothetical protein CU024_0841 [Enterococcus faecium]|nr:hypothetical protein [Enterococcus faecium]MBK4787065.1 hypothetical protein [Enterococcus faecium]MBK4874553.1 hypothetical protein [Enterococcus faecium]
MSFFVKEEKNILYWLLKKNLIFLLKIVAFATKRGKLVLQTK